MGIPTLPLVFLSIFAAFASAASSPRALQWSTKTYGPDGPWQAVKVQIGTPEQSVDLLPGGFWMSNILGSQLCANTKLVPACYAQAGGLYNSLASTSWKNITGTASLVNAAFENTIGALPLVGSANWVFDKLRVFFTDASAFDVPDFDMLVVSDGSYSLADGTKYPITIGTLSLGSQASNQTWVNGSEIWNGTFLASSLAQSSQIPSNSFGLHVGSASLAIPGSLIVGGYDRSRIVGPVSSQLYGIDYLPIDLLDIGIGVADGSSPFNFKTKSGLLAQGNSSIGPSVNVHIDTALPYLYLPSSTCAAITAHLPVTYQSRYGLYFWDTADPHYRTIVSSPSYLSFTFRLNNSITLNTTINVPFALLNLTLTSPIIDTPTPYFPCTQPRGINSEYKLGRAFLQAAFVGVNWHAGNDGVWWLAQAPGPNTPSRTISTAIAPTDNYVMASDSRWVDSWRGAWTVIGTSTAINGSTSTGTSPNSETTTNSNSNNTAGISVALSTGAIVGISISVVAIIALVAAGIIFVTRRARSQAVQQFEDGSKAHTNSSHSSTGSGGSWIPNTYKESGFGPRELPDRYSREPAELG
jgi:hypothetical protein